MGIELNSYDPVFNYKVNITTLNYLRSAPQGFKCDELIMSFKSVFQDVRNAVDYVHMQVCYGNKMKEILPLLLLMEV